MVPYKKSGRGPKPKYLFGTQEEAADARRERNRKAALDSYYRQASGLCRRALQLLPPGTAAAAAASAAGLCCVGVGCS